MSENRWLTLQQIVNEKLQNPRAYHSVRRVLLASTNKRKIGLGMKNIRWLWPEWEIDRLFPGGRL